MNEEARLAIRDRLGLPLTDERRRAPSSIGRPRTAPSSRTCSSAARRSAAACPRATPRRSRCRRPPPFTTVLEGSGERENSTTMAFVRILNTLVRDPALGERVVPIVPDESRTFGMEGMFRQLGIFSQVGQLY